MQDSTQSIFRSASRFFSGTVLSRISGLARDIVMAFVFGTGTHVSAFLVAFRFAHLLRRLFGESALQSAFVPLFETLRDQSPGRARKFFFDLEKGLALLLVGVIALGMLGIGSILMFGNLPSSAYEVMNLTFIMLPSLLFICLYGLNAAFLQCHHSYFVPAVSPVAFNIIWIVGMLWLLNVPEQVAMPYLSIWIVLACFGQWICTIPTTRSFLKKYPVEKSDHSDLKLMGYPMFMGVIGVAATQINNFLDAVFARFASLDGPALLWYSVRIEQLPLALFGIALSGAILPPLTRAYKAGNIDQYKKFLLFSINRTTLLLIPCTFAMFWLSVSGITLVYARGDFGLESVVGTTLCLWGYALGLWPMGLIQVFAPAFYAQGNYRVPLQASVLSMFLNSILNTWFVFGLGWGAVSIAIATSVSAWVNACFLGWYLRINMKSFFACFASVMLASVAGTALLLFFDQISHTSLVDQATHLMSLSFWQKSLHFLMQALLFCVGCGAILYFTKRSWKY